MRSVISFTLWRISFSTLLLCLLPNVFTAQTPETFFGQIDPELVPDNRGFGVYALKKATAQEQAQLTDSLPAAAQVFSCKKGGIPLRKNGLAILLVEPQEGMPFLYADLNDDQRWTTEEKFVYQPFDESPWYSGRLTIRVPLANSFFKFWPVLCVIRRPGTTPLPDKESRYLLAADASAFGTVDLPGRKVRVKYSLDFQTGFINLTQGSFGMDCDGDGEINSSSGSPETTQARDETIIFRAGDQYLSTQAADSATGRIVLRSHPASDYERIELSPGVQVPDFSFTDFEGKARKLSDFRGKYLLLDFWGSWCGPCIGDFPNLKGVYAQFQSRGFEILGMDNDENLTAAKDALGKYGVTWTQATTDSIKTLLEKRFRITSFPTKILLDPQGRVLSIGAENQLPLHGAELLGSMMRLIPPVPMPSLREQAELQQQWLKLRLERVLPALMRKHNVKMWLVICREYNEDPVYRSLTSPTVFAARRRTILVFHDKGESSGVERLALGGGSNGGLYTVYRDPEVENRELYGEGQWALLRKLIADRDPQTIAVNISATHAFSDGLSAGEWEKFQSVLDPKYKGRIVRAENLPLEYIATRLPEMLPVYQQMMQHVHSLLSRAFSSEIITPGKTTSQDVVWWLRQQTHNAGFGTWFQPTVRVQRQGSGIPSNLAEDAPVVIERGDVLHVDYGLTAMGLATDTQHMAYVLKPGETDAPAGIRKALLNTNRMQDILMSEMKPGRTGNEVLASAIAAMKAEKINGTFYTHPIGDHGHGAGPLIGLWDRQEGVPGRGDVKLIPQMWHSIELGARTPVPEWNGQELFVGQEEDAVMDADGKMSWILRRQTKYHLVK